MPNFIDYGIDSNTYFHLKRLIDIDLILFVHKLYMTWVNMVQNLEFNWQLCFETILPSCEPYLYKDKCYVRSLIQGGVWHCGNKVPRLGTTIGKCPHYKLAPTRPPDMSI